MKAVRKLKSRIAYTVFAAAGICVMFCANPIDEPLKWRTKVEIPVTNDTFYLGQEMPGLLKNLKTENIDLLLAGISTAKSGIMYDTLSPTTFIKDTVKGDTVVFSILRKDSISYTTSEDTMETKMFHPVLGPITVTNADTMKQSLPLPPAAGSITVPFYIKVPKIYGITFDSSSPSLSVAVTNTSTTPTAIASVSITMLGTTQTLANPLNQGETQILHFPTGNQGFTDSMAVSVTETSSAGAGKSLSINFNCNGLITSFIRCDDHLISFSKTFTNDYGLTDTLDVDYIDMASGAFVYELNNYTHIPLEALAEQLHLWDVAFMVRNNIVKFEDIANIPPVDSLGGGKYWGFLTTGFMAVPVNDTRLFKAANLSQCRLFPVWNDTITNRNGTKGKSVSRVRYTVRNTAPTGAIVTISAADSMLFTIKAPGFKFKEMYGTVKQAYMREGDTAKIQVPFPFNKGSKDSLRGNFFLKNVEADIYMTPNLPDTNTFQTRPAFIDTLIVTYKLLNPVMPDSQAVGTAKFLNVSNEKLFRTKLTMTKILNQWPDSMFIAVRINIPVGTHLRAVTDLSDKDPDYDKFMGRMKIKAVNTVRMNAVLDWEVRDTAHLDLGTGKFSIGKGYKIANKLQDRSFKFYMNAYNNTNAYINIYALAAPDSIHRKTLDSMSVDNTWKLIQNPTQARSQGFISLLGNRGVRIPSRGRLDSSNIDLNETDLLKILTTDTCDFRWQARFIPYKTPPSDSSDALHDVDFIRIGSFAKVEGTNSMDSLLIWEKDTTN